MGSGCRYKGVQSVLKVSYTMEEILEWEDNVEGS